MQNTLGVTERDQRLRPALCQWSTQGSAVALCAPPFTLRDDCAAPPLVLAEYHLPSSADDIRTGSAGKRDGGLRSLQKSCEEHFFTARVY